MLLHLPFIVPPRRGRALHLFTMAGHFALVALLRFGSFLHAARISFFRRALLRHTLLNLGVEALPPRFGFPLQARILLLKPSCLGQALGSFALPPPSRRKAGLHLRKGISLDPS